MNIMIQRPGMSYSDLKSGDVFYYDGEYFIRTTDERCAVNLRNGTRHASFEPETKVICCPNATLFPFFV